MMRPLEATPAFALAPGVLALGSGCALLTRSRTLLCADAHLGYEDVIGGGGALPLWSTADIAAALSRAAVRAQARELVFLGDVVHASAMSEGAIRAVVAALAALRAQLPVTFVAGNHEGRSRGAAVLGATVETCERDGWLLLHGDKPAPPGARAVIGHLHPSVHLGGGATAPAFLGSERVVVVPAMTPYSRGLDVRSDACLAALAPWDVRRRDLQVAAVADERVYPFGTLSRLHAVLARPAAAAGPAVRFRRRLRPDG